MESRERLSRIDHVDGLRGLAVLLVVLYHASQTSSLTTDHSTPIARFISGALGEGEQGVSLFLVISGFCLAYPMLRKRARGNTQWLDLRGFAARRIYRIVPPYYAALGLYAGLALAFQARGIWPLPMSMNVQPDIGDIAAHLLFLHNVTSHPFTLNASFWSLGLEWQWYFAFPVLLVAYLRWPRGTL